MIQLSDFADIRTHAPLTAQDVMVLLSGIRKFKKYTDSPARWPFIKEALDNQTDVAAVAPTNGGVAYDAEKAKALSIVAWKLDDLGGELATKEGGDAATFFSIRENREDLLDDILNILYAAPGPTGPRSWSLVQRTIPCCNRYPCLCWKGWW